MTVLPAPAESAATMFYFFPIWLDVPHLTNEHRTQDCIASLLGILHIASLAAHTTLNTYKPMEINIEKSPQH